MKFLENIFSIKNNKEGFKVLTILNVKIKFKKLFFEYENYVKQYSACFNSIVKTKKSLKFFEKNGFRFFIKYFLFRYLIKRKISIIHLEYKLLTKCTLNCKECCHYAPYFKKQMPPITFGEFKNGLDKLLKSVDLIYSLNFMGGEALLSKDLPQMIDYALSKKQIINCNLTTNGLTLPSKELLNSIKSKNNFIVYISNYSLNKSLKPLLKLQEIEKLLKENNVNYFYLQYENWHKTPRLSLNGKKYNNNAAKCWMTSCKTYAGGKIYFCPLEFYADFNNLPLEIKQDETVDIFHNSPKNNAKKLIKFYLKSGYNFCNHCKLSVDEKVKIAEQIPPNIKEIDN